jgi:hypothetical protein
MDPNTHSTSAPAGLSALVVELQDLADQDPDGLADGACAERLLSLRGLMDRLEGHWAPRVGRRGCPRGRRR